MPSVLDLPVELLLDHLLPFLPARDLFALGATNHKYASICDDETIWRLRCKEDFNFSSSRTTRTNLKDWDWKLIYKRLRDPKVFVWGSADHGRLGNPQLSGLSRGGVPYPVQVNFPRNAAIVDLIAGGWSFHALDSWGRVYVWGALNPMSALWGHGFSSPGRVSRVPSRLELPERVRMVSCGRMHSMALDVKGQIWTFMSWGRPFRLVTPALDCSAPDSTPVQAECGWTYCAALTASGDVYIWWPFGIRVQQQFDVTMDQMDGEGTIPCVTWEVHRNPQRVPAIPNLPEFSKAPKAARQDEGETKIIKIAGMDGFLIALTNRGHVLKFGGLSNEMISVQHAQWEYLPKFSETEKIRAHPTFASGERKEGGKPDTPPPPGKVQITHITAHYRRFVAYTQEDNSIILRGDTGTTAESDPEILPELQYKSIISICLGHYHNVALTANGKVYSWGSYQMGALGLGLPEELPVGAPGGYATDQQLDRARLGHRGQVPDVRIPTEVRFDHGLKKKRERFSFAATAAGWHSGALVIDLDPEEGDMEGGDEHESTGQM